MLHGPEDGDEGAEGLLLGHGRVKEAPLLRAARLTLTSGSSGCPDLQQLHANNTLVCHARFGLVMLGLEELQSCHSV